MLDLHKNARPDERFHLQKGPPVPVVKRSWFHKLVTWENLFLPDGSPGKWSSWWIFGNAFHWYKGTSKCDGTRTRLYWQGDLDDGQGEKYTPDPTLYVMTTTPKEMLSVRFFVDPGDPVWDNMGGS